MASKSRSEADNNFIATLQMMYDYNYIKMHHWRKGYDFHHKKIKMILMKNVNRSNVPYHRYSERYIIGNSNYSTIHTDVVDYLSLVDGIFVKILKEDNKLELKKLSPVDLSVEFSIESDLIEFYVDDGCGWNKLGSTVCIFTSNRENKKLTLYTLDGEVIKEVDTETPSILFDNIREISDNTFLIDDELIELDKSGKRVKHRENWKIHEICNTYNVNIDKESLDKLEKGLSEQLEIFYGLTYGCHTNEKYIEKCIMFNKFSGQLYINKDDKSMYKINGLEFENISGERIIEILKFIGSKISLELADKIESTNYFEESVCDSLTVLKIGENIKTTLFSDNNLLFNSHNRKGWHSTRNYNSNELAGSLKYFIKTKESLMGMSSYCSEKYNVSIVTKEEFDNDIDNSLKILDRIKNNK